MDKLLYNKPYLKPTQFFQASTECKEEKKKKQTKENQPHPITPFYAFSQTKKNFYLRSRI